MDWKEIEPKLLRKDRLNVLSLGSVCGIGVGIVFGTFFPFFWINILIGLSILGIGIYIIMKNIYTLIY